MCHHVIIIAGMLLIIWNNHKSPVSISSTFHDVNKRIASYQDGCCLGIFFIWLLGPFVEVFVAFVIRQGGALWTISKMLSQLTFSMWSGMFLFHGISDYVVLTRS